ncbi:hypothetical protein AMELA_G00235200 [Ameiurus melas]|uniref:TNF family profile domain-containing protein n=1 Tax=Ameiurus melas TaxID=219545 RepID=A0A7J6A0M1_AMEME|nr:hypothetical protein AMELA_G00235200 [Ameiurus melas]
MFLSLREPKRARDARLIAFFTFKRKKRERKKERKRRGFYARFGLNQTSGTNSSISNSFITMSSTDVESLQPGPRRRGSCMDTFLLVSVLTLFLMVLSGAALGFWIVKDLRAEMHGVHTAPEPFRSAMNMTLRGLPNAYKMENFAYLRAISSPVKNGTMLWEPIVYRNSTTMGSRYKFNSEHGALRMEKGGTYFMYTQLNLTCTWRCGGGSLSVTFEDNQGKEHLSCTLHLPDTTSIPVVEKCWTVIHHLEPNSRLIAKMHATVPPRGWSLDLNHSGFGMFLVDGPM